MEEIDLTLRGTFSPENDRMRARNRNALLAPDTFEFIDSTFHNMFSWFDTKIKEHTFDYEEQCFFALSRLFGEDMTPAIAECPSDPYYWYMMFDPNTCECCGAKINALNRKGRSYCFDCHIRDLENKEKKFSL